MENQEAKRKQKKFVREQHGTVLFLYLVPIKDKEKQQIAKEAETIQI
jgi:hypothetical protein